MDIIDWSALEAYREVMGEEADSFIADIVQTYLNNSQTLMTQLSEAFQAGDVATFHRTAHTLKSSSATVGATAVSELALTLEKTTVSEFPADTEKLLANLKQAYQEVITRLEEFLKAS
jgi:HPt (histidine-containing phosphotransfer) domain-containing protein